MEPPSHPENKPTPPRPNTIRALGALFAVVLMGLGLTMIFWPTHRVPAKKAKAPASSAQSSTRDVLPSANLASPLSATRSPFSPEPPSPLADELNSPRTTIQRDLQILNAVLLAWQTNFHGQGNPVGDNAAITAALTGKNPLNFQFIPRDHPAINASGELCDRWDTPFFFHALSGTRMEIRSAGPDRQMYTDDDIVFTP
jgi:hypothetical protein